MKFIVYSRRWGHKNVYGIKITKTGWYVKYAGISGDCNNRGEPYLFELLENDYIDFPENLGDYFAYLWENAQNMGNDKIQERLNDISEWIQGENKASMKQDFWKELTH